MWQTERCATVNGCLLAKSLQSPPLLASTTSQSLHRFCPLSYKPGASVHSTAPWTCPRLPSTSCQTPQLHVEGQAGRHTQRTFDLGDMFWMMRFLILSLILHQSHPLTKHQAPSSRYRHRYHTVPVPLRHIRLLLCRRIQQHVHCCCDVLIHDDNE